MMLYYKEYTFATPVPKDWRDFNKARNYLQEDVEFRFTKPEAEAIMNIINARWSDFAGKDAIVIEVEGYKCLTYITNQFTPVECADKVFPFKGSRTYPMQFIEKTINFKR